MFNFQQSKYKINTTLKNQIKKTKDQNKNKNKKKKKEEKSLCKLTVISLIIIIQNDFFII